MNIRRSHGLATGGAAVVGEIGHARLHPHAKPGLERGFDRMRRLAGKPEDIARLVERYRRLIAELDRDDAFALSPPGFATSRAAMRTDSPR